VLAQGLLGTPADPAAAARWYERAAAQGYEGALLQLTNLRLSGDAEPQTLAKLHQLWLQRANEGNTEAQRRVGEFFMRGIGCAASPDEARRWLHEAAQGGDVPAMVLMAGWLLQQPNADADAHTAVELLRRAAATGHADAQYNLGVCLRRGLGTARNDAEAEANYRAAATHGHPSAQLALGSVLAQRASNDAQWSEVANWYRQSADRGHGGALASLAQLHEMGRGVKQDLRAALNLYRQAHARGHTAAQAEAQRVEGQLLNQRRSG
jgi:TPR repeat protein